MTYDLFYRNRRLLALVIILIIVGGLSAFAVLPRMEDPSLVPRAQNIITVYPGRSAVDVETQVTELIEDQINEIEEVKEYRSISRAGVSFISVELRDEVKESEKVWSRMRDKVADIEVDLPPNASRPQFDEMDFKANAMILALKWDHPGETNYAILRRQAEELKDQLMAIPGTEKIDIFGDPQEEILVELDAAKIAAIGLTAEEVSNLIFQSDSKSTAGQLRGPTSDLLLGVAGELKTVADVAAIPIQIASTNGSFVRLGDLGTVTKKYREPVESMAVVDGQNSIVLGLFVRENYRIDLWSTRVNQHLEEVDKKLPAGIELRVIFEQNGYVQDRLIKLGLSLGFGGIAVVIVILFTMGWRNALVVSSALPFTAMIVLTGLNLCGVPVHQMSVTGIIIALGLLIDNAIVIVDEVSMRMEKGESASSAISNCVKQLAIPLLGSTLTTAFAFAPIALMPGPAGEFVGSIALSVIFAIFGSLFLSMTVIAAFAGIYSPFRNRTNIPDHHWWVAGLKPDRISSEYERSLKFVFSKPLVGLAIGVALPAFGFLQALSLPEQFFPPSERDQIQIELDMPNQASLANTLDTAMRIRELFIKHPRVQHVDWFLGESAPTFYYNVIPRRKNFPNYAQAIVTLDSKEDLPPLIHELQHLADQTFTNARVLVRQLEQGPPFDAPIEVRLFGPSLEVLRRKGDELRELIVATPNVIHTRSDLMEARPKLDFEVDEEKARLVGLTNQEIARQLNQTLEGQTGGSIREETEELPVRVRISNDNRKDMNMIRGLQVLGPDSAASEDSLLLPGIPISSLGNDRLINEESTIVHLSGRRMNEIQVFIPAGVLPANVLNPIRQRIKDKGFEESLSFEYDLDYGGEAAKRDEAVGNLFSFVGILAVLMAATLVLSFGSFRMAAIVASVALLSVGLGMFSLWLFGFPFGFMAIVGTMGLIGVAINDTIVVLAAIKADERARTGDPEAMRQVVMHSSRHIVSTSLTTMAGFTPLILGGGGFWPPLAVTIAGGVLGATVLALYYVPALYIFLMCQGCEENSADNPSLATDPVK